MDGIVLLKDDHRLAEGLFQSSRGRGAPRPQRPGGSWCSSRAGLVTHSFIEETICYPAGKAEAQAVPLALSLAKS